MTKKWQKSAMLLAVVMLASATATQFAGCKPTEPEANGYGIEKRERTGWEDEKQYTFNDYTSQMPDVWNEIFTSDATNTSMAGYLNSSFFEYDYKYDENGDIVPGGFTVQYSAATKLEDVTADYVGQYGITEEMAAEGHHAFAITLRNDLKWDDGTAIKAEDFVYTMSQQLSPNYLFETASNYYSGNYIVHNANAYVKQGQKGWFEARNTYGTYTDSLDSSLIFTVGNTTDNETYNGVVCNMRTLMGFPDSYTAEMCASYLVSNGCATTADAILALQGKTFAEIKADATMKETWDAVIGWWQTEPNKELDFFVTNYTYPEMDFSEVGYFVGENEYELVLVIDNTLSPIGEDGSLTYEAAYYLQSFPLVKKALWESLEDQTTSPWTNKYCSVGVANSASWGPYKLTNYQAGVTYTLSRNEKWYGYGLTQYAKQFQTDTMVTRYVPEWNTAWQMFQKGEIDGIGMDVSIAADYRNSSQAYFTPETWTFSLNMQSNPAVRTAERNNLLLKYDEFRKAVSLAINRDDYCAQNSPSSQAALGYLNQMYYYDVANGKIYRETTQAKEAILKAYGAEQTANGWKVGNVEYTDLDEAVDAVTGYNLTLAKELMEQAYNKAVAAGDYAKGEKIVLTYGIETQTANTDRVRDWFQNMFNKATEGTSLEGMVEIKYFQFSSATWTDQFKNGEYDLMFSAWGSAAFNPYYLFGETQINATNRYALGWDPSKVELELTINGDGTDKCPEKTLTLNLEQWNDCMQGAEGAAFNATLYPVEDQLKILGALEEAVLKAYWAIPVYSRYAASLMGYKCDYTSYDYNTFMSYGGIQYMTYHFDDAEWAEFVKAQGGTLNYNFGRED